MKTLSLRLALLGAGVATLASGASAQGLCSQNTDSTTIEAGLGISCSNMGIATENQFLRRFSADTDCGAADGHIVNAVTWGAESAVGAGGSGTQPISVRVYSIPTGAPLLYANMTLVSSEENIPYGDMDGLVTTVLSSPACIFPGQDTVLEVAKLTALADGHAFFPAANSLGQSADCFIASAACSIPDPIALSAIGFADSHFIITMDQTPLVGAKFCGPNTANSTGDSADITAIGSDVATDNDLTLQVKNLPNDSSGYFLISDAQTTVMNPGGSQGDLCIASFTLGRYSNMVLDTGMGNSVELSLDLANTPIQPGGVFAIVAGETWNWQYWYRDSMGGMPVSNFSDALSVTFQ